jgi:hypothetical protein
MRESRINDMEVGDTKNEFPHGNAWKQASFPQQAIICGSLKFE